MCRVKVFVYFLFLDELLSSNNHRPRTDSTRSRRTAYERSGLVSELSNVSILTASLEIRNMERQEGIQTERGNITPVYVIGVVLATFYCRKSR